MKYGNFQDPVGLVGRMLKSGNPAAYSSLLREFFSIMAGPIDRMLQGQERYILQESNESSSLPIILIVGPPRGGTTLLYQVLASSLPVSYFNNFSALFPRSPISASRLFQKILTNTHHSSNFNNYYGNTQRLSEPNDGFHIWNRWLGTNRYESKRDLSSVAKGEMHHFFNTWLTIFNQPFLNKNNRNLYCMNILSKCLDNVYFIVVHRDPVFIAQSLFFARQKIQGDQEVGWGLGSNQLSDYQGSDSALKSVAEQVAFIYSGLSEQRKAIESARIIDVQYEEFCQNPNQIIHHIYEKIWNISNNNPSTSLPVIQSFDVSNRVRLSAQSFEKLQTFVDEYWHQMVKPI